MKIYAVSDMHGNLDGLDPSGYDVCVIAGDFARLRGFGKWRVIEQRDWVQDVFCSWIKAYPNVQFVVVPGNHDLFADPKYSLTWPGAIRPVAWPTNARMLVNSGCEIDGVLFWGTPNVPVINYNWAFESEHDQLVKAFSAIPSGADVLITHAPPRIPNQLVDVSLERGINSERFGSVELTQAIFDKRPCILFCGHIHSGDHICREFECCSVYNVSRVNESYEIAYEPAVVEL